MLLVLGAGGGRLILLLGVDILFCFDNVLSDFIMTRSRRVPPKQPRWRMIKLSWWLVGRQVLTLCTLCCNSNLMRSSSTIWGLLALITQAEVEEHSYHTSQIIGASSTQRYFSKLAGGSYLKPLLNLCRLVSTCPLWPVVALTFIQPRLLPWIWIMQSVWCRMHWHKRFLKLAVCTLRRLVSSSAWHDSSLPGFLAILFHGNPEEVKAGVQRLNDMFNAATWCSELCPKARQMAKHSVTSSSFFTWISLRLQIYDSNGVDPAVAQIVGDLFGWGLPVCDQWEG